MSIVATKRSLTLQLALHRITAHRQPGEKYLRHTSKKN